MHRCAPTARRRSYVANAVDDADMGITHIIRGEDLINVTPKCCCSARRWASPTDPVFAHLPLIVNEQRKKLSKRRDDVSVEDYIDRGYLPEAMVQLPGRARAGDRPTASRSGRSTRSSSCSGWRTSTSAGAFFDLKKLDHFNGEYIRALPADEFVEPRVTRWLFDDPPWPPERFDATVFENLAPLVQERVTTLSEAPGYVDFLFLPDPVVDEPSWQKPSSRIRRPPRRCWTRSRDLPDCEWEPGVLMATVKDEGERLELAKSLYRGGGVVRVAVTGRAVGPPLGEAMQLLGRDEVVRRIRDARARITV